MASEEGDKPKDEKKLEDKNEEDNQIPFANDKLDYKELYYSQPSQKDKVKKDFTEYSQIDMSLLNKKRERTIEENGGNHQLKDEQNTNNNNEMKKEEKVEENKTNNNINENIINNNKKEEEIKENDLENNLPKELLDLIESRKDKEPFTLEDFEKYKAYKKLSVNFSKQA